MTKAETMIVKSIGLLSKHVEEFDGDTFTGDIDELVADLGDTVLVLQKLSKKATTLTVAAPVPTVAAKTPEA